MVGQWPTIELMDFEWDMAKSDLCQISRNFDFTYVIAVFIDPNLLIERSALGLWGGAISGIGLAR